MSKSQGAAEQAGKVLDSLGEATDSSQGVPFSAAFDKKPSVQAHHLNQTS